MSKLLKALAALSAIVALGVADASPVSGQGTWNDTLKARDINGRPVGLNSSRAVFIYDTLLDVTWLRDANVIGPQVWSDASFWVDSLTVGAFSDWRLPFILDTGALGCDFSYAGGTDCGYRVQTKTGDTVYSELAHMFYLTLGNTSYYDVDGVGPQPGSGLTNTGPFHDLLSTSKIYWSSNEYPYDDTHQNDVWVFRLSDGFQGSNVKGGLWYAWAVRDGDVCSPFPGGGNTGGCFPGPGPFPAPEPASLALVGAALLSVVATRRRKHTNLR